jgi:carbamoyltransferase
MGTDIDVLVAGDCLLTKEQQDPLLQRRYEGAFELD